MGKYFKFSGVKLVWRAWEIGF